MSKMQYVFASQKFFAKEIAFDVNLVGSDKHAGRNKKNAGPNY
jgi:hypothetical protein